MHTVHTCGFGCLSGEKLLANIQDDMTEHRGAGGFEFCQLIKPRSDIQVVNGSTAEHVHGLILKQMASIGIPSWLDVCRAQENLFGIHVTYYMFVFTRKFTCCYVEGYVV